MPAQTVVVIETLTSDGVLLLLSASGLLVTAVSIVLDARAERQRLTGQRLRVDG